jgi:hypothetical protein
MPCDTRLLTFNEMLRLARQRQAAICEHLTKCRAQIESAKTDVQAARRRLDRAIFHEAQAHKAYIDWLNYLNALPGSSSPPMREKLTVLFDANAQAVLETLSARGTVRRFQKALDEAIANFTFAEIEQSKIAEERNLITKEIAKLSGPSPGITPH